MARPAAALSTGLLGIIVLAGCTGASTPTPSSAIAPAAAPLPVGLTAYIDQGREQRESELIRVRLVNEAERFVTVTRAVVSSDRIDTVTWTGDKTFQNEADLVIEPPLGRCGTGSDADVELTYRIDDGPVQTSMTRATDRYHQIGLVLDRDCAERTLAEAAMVTIGEPRVVGTGIDSVFELPVTVTPTGGRDDVSLVGYADTVLFSQTTGSTSAETGSPRPVSGPAFDAPLRLVPSRCDPHALAEDKVGTLIGVVVTAADVGPGAAYYLPISDATRSALRRFFSTHCGLI